MAGNSDYLAEAILNFSTGQQPFPSIGNRFLALFTTAPTSDAGTGGTEVSGGSYARTQVAGAVAATAAGRVGLAGVSTAIGQARGLMRGVAPMVALAGSTIGAASGRGVMAGRSVLHATASSMSSARLAVRRAADLIVDPLFVAAAFARLDIATGFARIFLTQQKVPGMPLGNNLSPIDPVIETVTVTFDFGSWLNDGVTITAVTAVSCQVASRSVGVDPDPSGRLYGTPQITASPTTSAPSAAVLQQITDCVASVTYLLQCTVATSDNQELNLGTYLPCVAIN